jgi:deoxyribonuclease V
MVSDDDGAVRPDGTTIDWPPSPPPWPPSPPPWPPTAADLAATQERLARATAPSRPAPRDLDAVAACFVCFERGRSGPGAAGDRGWAAACLTLPQGQPVITVVRGPAAAPYEPGLLALRDGPLLEAALRELPQRPNILLVNATGLDHPRRAGLALHLGSRLGVPSIGVTNRPLLAAGLPPDDRRGAVSALRIGDEVVAHWVRTRRGTRPLVAHPGWGTDPQQAVDLLLRSTERWRTPLPLRVARQAARSARATDAGRS